MGVLAATRNKCDSLKYAKVRPFCRHCLKAAGLWQSEQIYGEEERTHFRAEKAILSLSSCNAFFSSSWEATSYAAQFAVAMKTDPFLGNFQTYEPRVTCIHLCDPTFSGTDHPCRGTVDTCLFPRQLNFDADSRP